MRRISLLFCLVSSLASADTVLQNQGANVGPVTRLNCSGADITCSRSLNVGTMTVVSSKTAAAVQLYVDPTGNDSNACLATTTSACLTIQGALGKLPKNLRHKAVINVAAGSYAGFNVSGFVSDLTTQQATAGILIDGTMVNSTPSTGTATGTATAGAGGANETFGTVTDSTQNWVTNDLRGRFIVLTGGTGVGQVKVISSNTATTITAVGLFSPAPAGGTTYAIQDSASFISSCQLFPPSASGTQGSSNASVRTQANGTGTTVTLRGLAFTGACNFGIYQIGNETLILNRLQFPSSGGTASHISLSSGFFVDTIASTYASTSGSHITGGGLANVNASAAGGVGNTSASASAAGTIQNALFVNGGAGVQTSFMQRSPTLMSFNECANVHLSCFSTMNAINFSGNRVNCDADPASVGILSSGASGQPSGVVGIQHDTISNCGTAIQLNGIGYAPSVFVVTAVTGITTAIDVRNGGLLTLAGGNVFTASGNEISLDNGGVVAPLSSIPISGNCLTSLGYGSRVCRD